MYMLADLAEGSSASAAAAAAPPQCQCEFKDICAHALQGAVGRTRLI